MVRSGRRSRASITGKAINIRDVRSNGVPSAILEKGTNLSDLRVLALRLFDRLEQRECHGRRLTAEAAGRRGSPPDDPPPPEQDAHRAGRDSTLPTARRESTTTPTRRRHPADNTAPLPAPTAPPYAPSPSRRGPDRGFAIATPAVAGPRKIRRPPTIPPRRSGRLSARFTDATTALDRIDLRTLTSMGLSLATLPSVRDTVRCGLETCTAVDPGCDLIKAPKS